MERLKGLLEIFDEKPALWVALRSIANHPQQELAVETPFVDVGSAHALDASMLGVSAFQPSSIAPTGRMAHFTSHGEKWRFLRVYDRRIVRRECTPANMFVAFFVRYSIRLVRTFAFANAHDPEIGEFFPDLLRIVRRLNGVWDTLSDGYKYAQLREIPLDNQLLQFDPHYHVVLQAYLACEAL